ncbi:MAG TPA: DUF2167 domain-containing protein [Gallionellaceae bacterium]|nr:DUF2167 domain-containing protein [Gallionellaceae bacterium]
MLKKLLYSFVLIFLSGFALSTWADPQPGKQMTAEQFVASLKFQNGKIDLPGGMASLDMPPNFRYLGPDDAEKVLVNAWGNPPGDKPLGMIFPADVSPLSPDAWGVIITYMDDGHVKDDDASKIDYSDLLKQMKDNSAEADKERTSQGYPSLLLTGWAEPPRYDSATHKLYWALDLKSGDATEHTLNYKIRVLGRKGVLVLNAVAGMSQLPLIKGEMQKVIGFADFTPGNRYADFNSSTDKVAEYGVAALVAGAVAAKVGLFAKLFALLIAAKKLVVVGVLALVAGVRKLLGLKKKESPAE